MPPVHVRSCSGWRNLLGGCWIVASGLVVSTQVGSLGVHGTPFGPVRGTLINPLGPGGRVKPPIGPRRNTVGPYNWTSDGSRKPSPQVLRRVRLSSNGCQRRPTLGTAAFVSLFSHSSYRTPAEISNE